MNSDMINFDLPKNQSSHIKVLGVGGGGSNAVNYMFRQGIEGVDFIVCNTDSQALDSSPVPNKIQLGVSLTEGRGAGSIPAVGKNAAIEDLDRIKEILEKNTEMIFITAGMGGGTGTGAAPVIARACKEMGVLTVGIVTIPFAFEGRKRRLQAEEGIKEMKENVDALIIICNDKLRELYGNLSLTDAFSKADNVLTTAAKGIAEIITLTGGVNVDFADVKTVMSNSGVAIMGSGSAEGENRAYKAVEMALASPLLNDNNIKGANYVLLNIISGKAEILMDEIDEITEYIQAEAGMTADIIWGSGRDENLGNKINVTIVATGFGENSDLGFETRQTVKKVVSLDAPEPKPVQPLVEDDMGIKLVSRQAATAASSSSVEQRQPERKTIHELTTQTETQSPINEGLFQPRFVSNVKQMASEQPEIKSVPVEKTEPEIPNPYKDKMEEREKRLRELSLKIKTPDGLLDMEKEPAYKRRNMPLNAVPASDVSHVSRYTLADGEGKVQIKSNNSFLHDNVD
jgi:cell division protein FtsZ